MISSQVMKGMIKGMSWIRHTTNLSWVCISTWLQTRKHPVIRFCFCKTERLLLPAGEYSRMFNRHRQARSRARNRIMVRCGACNNVSIFSSQSRSPLWCTIRYLDSLGSDKAQSDKRKSWIDLIKAGVKWSNKIQFDPITHGTQNQN